MADWLEGHRLRLRAEAEAERAKEAADAEVAREWAAFNALRACEFGRKCFAPLEGRMTRLGPLTHVRRGGAVTFAAGGTPLGSIEFILVHGAGLSRWPLFEVGGVPCRARDTWGAALEWTPRGQMHRPAGLAVPFHELAVPGSPLTANAPAERPIASSLDELAEYLLNFMV